MSDLKERLHDMSVLSNSKTPADALSYIKELERKLEDKEAECEYLKEKLRY